mmetsp:Transcript_12608/g.30111  ORF Transcript_12608/g.30111 Transcript_12608/m.30111 type:complete len:512 (+) Transcript_12608:103-1638(+)
MLISQDFFDETLVESQELFEYSNEQAVTETINELKTSNPSVRLDHLSLTHPESQEGIDSRTKQKDFVEYLRREDVSAAINMLTTAIRAERKTLPTYTSLVLQNRFLAPDSKILLMFEQSEQELDTVLQFVSAILPDVTTNHPLATELKLQLAKPLEESWCSSFEKYPSLSTPLVKWARICCNACESNKKTLVRSAIEYRSRGGQSGLKLLLESLPKEVPNAENQQAAGEQFISEVCKLINIVCKFQAAAEAQPKDGETPTVSSAHANVKEFHKAGAVNVLHLLAKKCTDGDKEDLLCAILSALRVLAIDNDIVQNMVAVGLLDTANASLLSNEAISAPLAAATLGLLRNLCANDEIKTTICKKSLPSILHAMETHSSNSLVQEHGLGIIASMALRQPNNAKAICEANGAQFILSAMRAFPTKVPLQRQGALALRNMASRLPPESKQELLDAGAENILRDCAARHQASIDEAYAALRDLGCSAVMYKMDEHGNMQGTQMFGKVKSNFRAEYD